MSREADPLPPEAFLREIERQAPAFDLELTADARARLSRFLALLDRRRQTTNLTGRLDAGALVAHTLESVLGQGLVPGGARVLDVGSGAGFPGLPLAIARPDVRVKLLEVRRLRADFLRHVVETIPAPNAAVLEAGTPGVPENAFTVLTSRAVGDIARILGNAPFLTAGGVYLAWTTDAEALGRSLSAVFRLESVRKVPGTRRKVIARFRKSSQRP